MLPAYAGMIRCRWPTQASASCAPRVCGDDPPIYTALMTQIGVLPAYAGMIRAAGDS